VENNVYGFKAKSIDGREVCLDEFRGKTLLIVNVASQCGFTPQYAGLEALYRKYKDEGLVVLGFPCNQFGGQEPGSEPEIKSFCQTNYQVSFPLFAKIDVNGAGAHPLYQHLKKEKRGILFTKRIKWNFTKFLVDRNGRVVKRYGPATKPEALFKDVSAAIGGK
jgi:glutathione peroxidase